MQTSSDDDRVEKKMRVEKKEEEEADKALQRATYHKDIVSCVRISNDGLLVASGSADYTVKIWDTVTRKCIQTLTAHGRSVSSVAFSPDGKSMASGSHDGNVKIWNIATVECITTLRVQPPAQYDSIWCLEYSPNGDTLATVGSHGKLSLWNTSDWKIRCKLDEFPRTINAVAFSRDGKYLFLGTGVGIVTVWSTKTGAWVKTLRDHDRAIDSIALSNDGRWVASASDATIVIWDIDTWELVRKFEVKPHGSDSCTFSANDRYIFLTSPYVSAIVVYDTRTGICIGRIEIPYDMLDVPNRIMRFAFDIREGVCRAAALCSENPLRIVDLNEKIEALKLDSVVAAGLASQMPFLTKGLYDPRLLCEIRNWIGVLPWLKE